MNMNCIARCTLFCTALLAFSTVAVSSDVYKVQDFDVNGISLGDDAEQVITSLIKFYSVSRDDLDIEMSTNLGRKEKTIAYVDYKAEDFKVKTIFAPIGGYKGQLESEEPYYLAKLRISRPSGFEGFEEMVEKFTKKYGPPSYKIEDYMIYAWCEKLGAETDTCDKAHAELSISDRSVNFIVAEEINK